MATAQVDLTARVSRDSALLGDTVSYSVVARGGGGAEVFFVPLPDTLARGGEIYQEPKIDTLANSSEGVAFRLRMVVTSYDSGAVSLPRFGVLVRHAGVLDTLFSEPKSLYFYPTPREADVADIKDIRGPLAQRLTFAEVWPWLLGGLAVLLAIVGWLVYRRYMRRGEIVEAKRRLVPPGELALGGVRVASFFSGLLVFFSTRRPSAVGYSEMRLAGCLKRPSAPSVVTTPVRALTICRFL